METKLTSFREIPLSLLCLEEMRRDERAVDGEDVGVFGDETLRN